MSNPLYNAQNAFLNILGKIPGIHDIGGAIILCGGTALAREYLKHRVSYDLDFFVHSSFDPQRVLTLLGQNKINFENIEIENGGKFVSQCFGLWDYEGQKVKISFIEDSFPDMFDLRPITFADTQIKTEVLNGLYHRKLRTITGVTQTDLPQGGRQAARDLFDLFILDKTVKPIPQFIDEINSQGANFMEKAFSSGLGSMQWNDLMDEFNEIDYNRGNPVLNELDFENGVMGVIRSRMSDVINEVNGIEPNGKTFKP